jgi:hypothetical protein
MNLVMLGGHLPSYPLPTALAHDRDISQHFSPGACFLTSGHLFLTRFSQVRVLLPINNRKALHARRLRLKKLLRIILWSFLEAPAGILNRFWI